MGKNLEGFFVPEILDENVKNDGSESSFPVILPKNNISHMIQVFMDYFQFNVFYEV